MGFAVKKRGVRKAILQASLTLTTVAVLALFYKLQSYRSESISQPRDAVVIRGHSLRRLLYLTIDGAKSLNTSRTNNGTADEHTCTQPAYHEFPPDAFTNSQRRSGALVFHVLATVYMFIALAVVCDTYFITSMEKICEKLHLSADVAGATFMAAGSSAPELFTSIIGVFVAKGDVGVGTIVGSAVFNILFVIGICGILVGQIVMLTWFPLIRDSSFYLLSVILLISSIADSLVQWYEAALMLLLYIAYIVFMRFNTPIQEWAEARIFIFGQPSEDINKILPDDADHRCYNTYEMFSDTAPAGPVPPSSQGENPIAVDEYALTSDRRVSFEDACFRLMKGKQFKSKTRFRSASCIILLERRKLLDDEGIIARYRRKTFSYDSDTNSYTKAVRGGLDDGEDLEANASYMKRPDDGLSNVVKWLAMLPIYVLLHYTVPDCRQKRWEKWFLVTFCLSIVWIATFSYIMVWMVAVIGFTLGIPDSIMGITFLAAGTSVPDAMASVMVARQGQGDMAISNTIGSNVFDILIGLALPWFVQTTMIKSGSTVPINSNGIVFSVTMLFVTVIITISACHFGGWRLDKRLGIICLSSYAVFLLFSSLIEFNVFGYVNPPMCIE